MEPEFTLLFVLTLVDVLAFTLLLLFVEILLTSVLLMLVIVPEFTLLVLTVLVLVELLFVSTRVFESYVVCATEIDVAITKSTIIGNFFSIFPPKGIDKIVD